MYAFVGTSAALYAQITSIINACYIIHTPSGLSLVTSGLINIPASN